MSVDNDKFEIDGVRIWAHEWIPVRNMVAHVKDPFYGQDFAFQVYIIEDNGVRIEFAAGELSSDVRGVYLWR